MGSTEYDAIIIGGGIAGLSAAWRLRHRTVLVLEADDRVGGRIRSESRGDYWLNFGAHLFGEPDSPVGRLVSEFGLETRPITGDRMGIAYRGKVVSGGRSETFPLRLPLSAGGRVSFARMGLKLRSGVMRLLAEQQVRPNETRAARVERLLAFENRRTFGEFIGPLHPEVDELLRTILERTSSPPEGMSAGYGLSSFSQVWSPYAFGRNLLGGSARLPQAIALELGARVRLKARVTSVRSDADNVEVQWQEAGKHQRARARYAIVAAQANVARSIIGDLPQETAQALDQVRYGPFLSVAVLTRENSPMRWDRNYAIATPGLSFGVMFNQATTLRTGDRRPGGSLMLFRGAAGAAALLDASDQQIRDSFLSDLYRLYPEAKGIAAEAIVQRWPQGAPFASVGRAALQPALTRPLGRIFLAGDYLEFPCMDAAISTGTHAATEIGRSLAQEDERAIAIQPLSTAATPS